MKHTQHSAGPSQRQLRVCEQLRHIMADTLRRGHFTHEMLLNGSQNVTVTEVRPSPDLKHATAYVAVLGGGDSAEMLAALNAEAHAFQKDIGRQAGLKFTPRVRFATDTSFDQAQRIEDILRDIKEHDVREHKQD